ncbi:MAG: hypothetical protein R3C44_20570 [Chloroflexota bacterium]
MATEITYVGAGVTQRAQQVLQDEPIQLFIVTGSYLFGNGRSVQRPRQFHQLQEQVQAVAKMLGGKLDRLVHMAFIN